MTQDGKYLALPDLDSAPDIYETPTGADIDDDQKQDDHHSPVEDKSENEDDVLTSKIDRQRLQPSAARTQFLGARVDARGVNFSDRIDGVRKSYRTSSSSRRRKQRGFTSTADEFHGDLSDEGENDDEEPLDRRIARLNREIEEVRSVIEHGGGGEIGDVTHKISEMTRVLREVEITRESALTKRYEHENGHASISTTETLQSVRPTPSGNASYTDTSRILGKAADIDARLSVLERTLGASAAQLRQQDNSSANGVISSIDNLEKKIAALGSISATSLESMARQIHQLTQDAEALAEARIAAHEALKSTATPTGRIASRNTVPEVPQAKGNIEDAEQAAKVDALFAALPTVEMMAPLLPPVLERLRSLQLVHTDAAAVSENLSALENRQLLMTEEIAKWRVGLQKVEQAMQSGKATTGGNAEIVEGWVKDLEARLRKLGPAA